MLLKPRLLRFLGFLPWGRGRVKKNGIHALGQAHEVGGGQIEFSNKNILQFRVVIGRERTKARPGGLQEPVNELKKTTAVGPIQVVHIEDDFRAQEFLNQAGRDQ